MTPSTFITLTENLRRTIRIGKGSGRLIDFEYDDMHYYAAQAVEKVTGINIFRIAFLADITNGGQRGAGKSVVMAALKWCEGHDRVMVVIVHSEDARGQDRLLQWYRSLGLFRQEVSLDVTKHGTGVGPCLVVAH